MNRPLRQRFDEGALVIIDVERKRIAHEIFARGEMICGRARRNPSHRGHSPMSDLVDPAL